jgi:predicted nucleotidyltransferase component of viral defense system
LITERELRQIAARNTIGAGQAEHEYAQLCVLDALSQVSPLADTFCFKGGTALRLAYFADWRRSVDLDFSVLPMFPADDLQRLVESWFAEVYAWHGMEVRLLDFHRVNGAVRLRAQFVGPLRYPARLLFALTLDEPVLQTPQRRLVVASIFPTLQPTVLTYSLEEILAEKMRSIIQRGKARDYYDVWRLLVEKPDAYDPAVVSTTLGEKCRRKGMEEPRVQHFLVPRHLAQAQSY